MDSTEDGFEMTPEQVAKLAEYYHERECTLNHIDMCGWGWENAPSYPADKPKWSHEQWAKQVPKLVARDRQNIEAIKLILGGTA
jgi:G:T-mismatch repair DNA endonuclease (very short patch repair protein)